MRTSSHRSFPSQHRVVSWVTLPRAGILALCLVLGLMAGTARQIAAQKPKNVGAALIGPRNDRSYNQSLFEGANKAKDAFGLNLTVVDNVSDPTAIIDVIRNLARNNALVIAGSTKMATATERVAPDFPDVQFVVIGGRAKPARNLHFVDIDPRAGGYLTGVVAAKVSKTKILGFIGGALVQPTTETEKGFNLGAKATDPSITIKSVVVGSFDDAVKAKQAAAAQIAANADILFGWVDAAYPGIIQAIRESGKDVKAIGVATSKCNLGPENLGDHILAYDGATFDLLRTFSEGRAIDNVIFGVQDPKVQTIQLCPRFDQPDLQALITRTAKAVVSGEVKLGD